MRRRGVLVPDRLDGGIAAIAARAAPGVFGAAVMLPASGQTWYFGGDQSFPLASDFMLPIAAAALAQIDAGALTLDDRIKITEADLSAPPSGINRRWPTPPEHHAAVAPAIDLIALAVQQSDHTAADVIMKTIGGPAAVTAWLQAKGVEGMRIDRYERELQQDCAGMAPFQPGLKDEAAWEAARDAVPPQVREKAVAAFLADPRDTTTPKAAVAFLAKLATGQLLSDRRSALLLRLMGATAGGGGAMAAGLPPSSSLAHKQGVTRTDVGLTPADNDFGVATLPDGTRLIIATLISGSIATAAARGALVRDFTTLAVSAID